MDSVIQQIRQHREDSKRQTLISSSEIVIDGCPIKLNFDAVGDNKIIPAVQSILVSAFVDSLFTKVLSEMPIENDVEPIEYAINKKPHSIPTVSSLVAPNQKPSVIEQIRQAKNAPKSLRPRTAPIQQKKRTYAEL